VFESLRPDQPSLADASYGWLTPVSEPAKAGYGWLTPEDKT
jgi:hypothetical protein